MEEQWRAMAMAKVQAVEAEVHQVMEKLVAVAAARCRAVLAMVEAVAEEAGMEPDGGSLLKQKGWAEGEWRMCNAGV